MGFPVIQYNTPREFIRFFQPLHHFFPVRMGGESTELYDLGSYRMVFSEELYF